MSINLPSPTTKAQSDDRQKSLLPRLPGHLGGGVNPNVIAGREAGLVEKRHLVLKRWFQEQAVRGGRTFIDFGTDYYYPFYDDYGPTRLALDAIVQDRDSARHYPSSYGTVEVREEFARFMLRRFSIACDPQRDVMVSTGASQVFDALSRTYVGRYVLVPELALSTVTSIARGNGAEVVRIPTDADSLPDLDQLEEMVVRLGPTRIRFVYLNSPVNPTGAVLSRQYLTELVALARRHKVLVLHDQDSWFTVHSGEAAANILEVPGAREVAVTVMSLSKELGLPGIRVGFVMGNERVINELRIHNSEFCVMIPEFCQAAAAAALRAFEDDGERSRVQGRISVALEAAVRGWKQLGWPDEALKLPDAGYKFLLRPPEQFSDMQLRDVAGVELYPASEIGRAHV